MPHLARERGCDLLHSLANTGPVRPRLPHVLTIHDVHFFTLRALGRVSSFGHRQVVGRAARHADVLIAITTAARDEIADVLELPRANFAVVPHGAQPPRVAPARETEVRRRLRLGTPGWSSAWRPSARTRTRSSCCARFRCYRPTSSSSSRAMPRHMTSSFAGLPTQTGSRSVCASPTTFPTRVGGAVGNGGVRRAAHARRGVRAPRRGSNGARGAIGVLGPAGTARGWRGRPPLLRPGRPGCSGRCDPRRHGGRQRRPQGPGARGCLLLG